MILVFNFGLVLVRFDFGCLVGFANLGIDFLSGFILGVWVGLMMIWFLFSKIVLVLFDLGVWLG